MRWLKWLAIGSGGVVVVGVALLVVIGALVTGHRVTQKALSPSGRYLAVVEEFDSGGLSGWDTDVVIRKRPFIVSALYPGTAAEIFYLYGPPSAVRVRWISDSELVVECKGCKGMPQKIWHRRWRDISITYSARDEARLGGEPD